MSERRRMMMLQEIASGFVPDANTVALWQVVNGVAKDVVNDCRFIDIEYYNRPNVASGISCPYGTPFVLENMNYYIATENQQETTVFDPRFNDFTVDFFFKKRGGDCNLFTMVLINNWEIQVSLSNHNIHIEVEGTDTNTLVSVNNDWHHFAACYNHYTRTLDVFLDGTYVATSNRNESTNSNSYPRTFTARYAYICNYRISNTRRWWRDTIQSVTDVNYATVPKSALPSGATAATGVLTGNSYYCAVGDFLIAKRYVTNPVFYLLQSGNTINAYLVKSGPNVYCVSSGGTITTTFSGTIRASDNSAFSKTIKDILGTFNGMTLREVSDSYNGTPSSVNGYVLGNGYIVSDTQFR